MIQINLNEICKKILDTNEEISFNIKPFNKKSLYIDKKNIYFLIIIGVSFVLSGLILVFVLLNLNRQLIDLDLYTIFIILIVLPLTFTFLSHLAYLMFSNVGNKILLKNTEYFITNKRFLSLTLNFDNSITVINLSFNKIDYFYFNLLKSNPIRIHSLCFKIPEINEILINEIFLELRAPNFFQPNIQNEYQTPKISFLLRCENIGNKDELLEHLIQVLPDKYKETPPVLDYWEYYWDIIKAHCPG